MPRRRLRDRRPLRDRVPPRDRRIGPGRQRKRGSETPTRVTQDLPEKLAQTICYRNWKSAGAGVR